MESREKNLERQPSCVRKDTEPVEIVQEEHPAFDRGEALKEFEEELEEVIANSLKKAGSDKQGEETLNEKKQVWNIVSAHPKLFCHSFRAGG